MLLLLTIVLVLIAAATLLIGIFSDQLTLIYVSIASSVLAAIVLVIVSQVSRRRAAAPATPAPRPAPATPPPPPRPEPARDIYQPPPAPAPAEEPTRVMAGVGGRGGGGGPFGGGFDDAFPIENYDRLKVSEILPLLEDLDGDDLEAVAEREERGKNRTTILNRIDEILDEMEAEDAALAPPSAPEPEVAPPAPTPPAVADDEGFPIDDYERLSEDEILDLLDDLDADELEAVAEREERNANRAAILDAIDDRLDELEGVDTGRPAAAAPAPEAVPSDEEEPIRPLAPVPATAAPAKKAPAKRAAKKAAPAGGPAAAPAKKATRATTKATKKA